MKKWLNLLKLVPFPSFSHLSYVIGQDPLCY